MTGLTTSDWAQIGLAVWAFVLSVWQAYQSHRSKVAGEKMLTLEGENSKLRAQINALNTTVANSLDKAKIELGFSQQISECRRRFEDLLIKLVEGEKEEMRVKTLAIILKSTQEDYLNAINNACEKYLSNRIERAAFEEQYRLPFLDLLDDKEIAAKVNALNTRFRHYKSVVAKWQEVQHVE